MPALCKNRAGIFIWAEALMKAYFFGAGFIKLLALLGTTTSLLFLGFFTSLLLLI